MDATLLKIWRSFLIGLSGFVDGALMVLDDAPACRHQVVELSSGSTMGDLRWVCKTCGAAVERSDIEEV